MSTGVKNPHQLNDLLGINAVQRYLTDEITDVFKNEGPIRKRNVETFVRAMTNLGEVVDGGDHPTLLPGDRVTLSEVNEFNRGLDSSKKQVISRPILKSVEVLPLEMQTDWIARMQARRLKDTVIDAAAEGWKSKVHGTHPIPGMAYGKSFGEGTKEAPWLY